MIIIRMTGGLGNQMFQYALYLRLTSMGKTVKFDDISEYQQDNARQIMLWAFGIDYPKADRDEINEVTDGSLKLSHRIRRKLFGRKSLEYHEKDCNFDENVLKKEPAYLTGYFQSEKYFEAVKTRVREAFTFQELIYRGLAEELKKSILAYRKRIEENTAVSLHIRRGDYLENTQVYGGNCTESYYKAAVSYMEGRYPEAVFFVFSNDTEWAAEWLARNYPAGGQGSWNQKFVLVQGISEEKGYLDMMLMSLCKHHIVANSSFSWWGAWLSGNPEKAVAAPSNWFNNQKCRDIYTGEMIKISPLGEVEERG